MQVKDADSQKLWDEFVTSHQEANFLHAWAWGEFHQDRGKSIVRRIVEKSGKIIAAYEGAVETAKRGTYLAIAGGPIMDWSDHSLVEFVFEDIKKQGQQNNCVFVRVRPQITDENENRQLFAELGAKPAPMYLSVELAGVLDLHLSEDEILKNASQRLRRALRKAAKNNVEIDVSVDPKDLAEFYKIQLETARRHSFVSFSEDFLTKQFATFAKYDAVKLYTARLDGEILAQNFMIFYGNEASYHYGVSTELGTKLSSAPLLHMQAMRDARERGIGRYNFWGITKTDDTKHRFYGVSQFKRGFGVSELAYLPAHDLVLRPAAYRLSALIEKARRKSRHV